MRSEPVHWWMYSDPPGNPSGNMAKDAWCMEQAEATGRPLLRLYEWDRPTLSVGRAQKVLREIDPQGVREAGVSLVRRGTGGRAVLHGSDLTYAVAAPAGRPEFQGGILRVYREISRVFEVFFRGLGIEPEVKAYTGRERAMQASAICFATPSAFEILVDGRKLVGSAQRMKARSLLQHGSLPLRSQTAMLAKVFRDTTPAAVAGTMTDLTTLGILPGLSQAQLRDRLAEAFAEVLGAVFDPGPFGEKDRARVAELEAQFPIFDPEAEEATGSGFRAGGTGGLKIQG